MSMYSSSSDQNEPFEDATVEGKARGRRIVVSILLTGIVASVVVFFYTLGWDATKKLATLGYDKYVKPYVERFAPQQEESEVPVNIVGVETQQPEELFYDLDFRGTSAEYEEPTIEVRDAKGCGTTMNRHPNARILFEGGERIEILSDGQVAEQVVVYTYPSGGDIATRVYPLPTGSVAMFAGNHFVVENCGDGLLAYIYVDLTKEKTQEQVAVNPIVDWKHRDACDLSDYVTSGTSEVIKTEKTSVDHGFAANSQQFRLHVVLQDGYQFSTEIYLKTGYLSYYVYQDGVVLPVGHGAWEYEFRGETLIAQLSNGDYLFIYLPWVDGGYPSQYLYTVASSLEAGGCQP